MSRDRPELCETPPHPSLQPPPLQHYNQHSLSGLSLQVQWQWSECCQLMLLSWCYWFNLHCLVNVAPAEEEVNVLGVFFAQKIPNMIKEGLRSCCGSIATLVCLKTSVDELTNQWDCCLSVLEWVVRRGRVYQRSELLLWQHTVVTHSESNPLSWLAGWRWFGKSETLNKTRPLPLFCRVASLPKGEGSKVSGLKREIWCPPHPVQLRIWTFCLTLVVLLCSLSDSRPTTLCVPMTRLVFNLWQPFLIVSPPWVYLAAPVCSPLYQVTPVLPPAVILFLNLSLVFLDPFILEPCYDGGIIVIQDPNVRKCIMHWWKYVELLVRKCVVVTCWQTFWQTMVLKCHLVWYEVRNVYISWMLWEESCNLMACAPKQKWLSLQDVKR